MVEGLKEYTISCKGLKNGASNYSFLLDDDFFSKWEESEILSGEVRAEVELIKASTSLHLSCHIEGSVVVECDRCLEPLTIEVSGDSESDSTFDGTAEENEGVVIDSVEEEILLADYLYQSVLLSLPYSRTHASTDECNPEMLAKFKIVTEEEFERLTASEGSLAENPEAAKLADLKQMLENKE